MLACWLLQGSLLVAPVAMGDAPPETRAAAIVNVRGDRDVLTRWQARMPSDLAEFARRIGSEPDSSISATVGTFTRAMLVSPALAQQLFEDDCSGRLEPVSPPIESNGGWFFVQCLEREAACRQILVAGTDETARARAESVLRELKAGADFAKLAREKSDDRASALRGGDLAIYERGSSDALLRAAAFEAKVGDLVGLIESPLGYHILQRVPVEQLDPRLRDDAWAHARAILVQFNGALGADPTLRREHDEAERIANELAGRIRGGEEMAKVACEFNDDRGGRERAGDVGWVRRATTHMPQFFDKLFIEPPGKLIGPIASTAGFVLLRREDPGQRSRIDLRKNAFVDLEQWVRKLAEAKTEPPAIDHLADAVAAARALDASFGSPLEWGRIEGDLVVSPTAADFVRHCEMQPENASTLSGRPVALRDLATTYAKALAAIEPFEPAEGNPEPEQRGASETWRAHQIVIDTALFELKQRITSLGDVALDELMRGLGMNDPRVVVPVYLVAEGPWPGGVTHRADHGGVCLIDADENKGSQLLETVLHESSHALDIATQGQDTALEALRKRMTAAGIDRRDRAARDVPHTLMFVTSAWVVRHVFDSTHKDYGDVAGYYAKVAAAAEAVRGPWTEFLDGKKSRDEALDAIVAAIKAKK